MLKLWGAHPRGAVVCVLPWGQGQISPAGDMLLQEAHEALQGALVRDGVLMLRLDGQQTQHEARLLLYLLPTGAAKPPHPSRRQLAGKQCPHAQQCQLTTSAAR